ncbi:MAG TPA: ECF-type sigma factor [Steroidobacteraceae bacterium]|nr:ECF-type sigma factor [Steroidobacteraceae bacterium]
MREVPSGEVTVLLQNWAKGDAKALDDLIPLVHRELQALAHRHLRAERANHTLQSTALVNEAYLKLVGSRPVDLQCRAHFIAIASRIMRQILVAHARGRRAEKRDGGEQVTFDALVDTLLKDDQELLALDEALEDLARIDSRQANIVELKFFGGLSAPEISQLLGLSRATVDRDWAVARLWLHQQMRQSILP